MSWVGPTAFCRLDQTLLDRVRRGQGTSNLALSAATTIAGGAGAYGIAFGVWRAGSQAAFSAVKLPLLLLSVALCTMGLGAMLAMLLRSRLTLAQTSVCMLLSFAVTATVLGATAPVSVAFDLLVPQRTPRVGHALLLFHVAVIAVAGVAGVVRLRTLLGKLGLEVVVARRVLVAWIAAQFLVGSQLCWLLRPFFGDPRVRPTFFADNVLSGSFFQAVGTLLTSTFGSGAPFVLVMLSLGLVAVLSTALYAEPGNVRAELGASGVMLSGDLSRIIAYADIAAVTYDALAVRLELVPNETLAQEVLSVPCGNSEAARELAASLVAARGRVGRGPFRT